MNLTTLRRQGTSSACMGAIVAMVGVAQTEHPEVNWFFPLVAGISSYPPASISELYSQFPLYSSSPLAPGFSGF